MKIVINKEPNWKDIPHEESPKKGEKLLVATGNTQPHRIAFFNSLPSLDVLPTEGGNENQELPLFLIALMKALHAKETIRSNPDEFGINPENPLHFVVAQDTKNENLPKPPSREAVILALRNILLRYQRTGTCYYTTESATAVVNGRIEVHSYKIKIQLNPQRIKEIYEQPNMFTAYCDACQEFAGISIYKVAGGLCFEALYALGAVTGVDQQSLANTSEKENQQLTQLGLHSVLAPIPTTVFHHEHIWPTRSEYGAMLQETAWKLQKETKVIR